jgi:hypothetical protein
MSLEDAVAGVAEQLMRQEFFEVYAHYDTDGIAAAAILCHALLRQDRHFRLRPLARIAPGQITGEHATLLCDLGAGIEDLPPEVMVVDHHLPAFEGKYHANPRESGIDGDCELSSSGTAYLVAQQMGDNRDLAGLAMLGMIGDRQELRGMNLEIFNEGVAEGIITPNRGLRLPGRDLQERYVNALHPYLPGLSGEPAVVQEILDRSQNGKGPDEDLLLSLALLRVSRHATPSAMESVYGDLCDLEREVITDARTLSDLVDACGKSGHGGLAAALCMRSNTNIDEAWDYARAYRSRVIDAVKGASTGSETLLCVEVQDAALKGDVADALAFDCTPPIALMVYAREGTQCHISVRCPPGCTREMGAELKSLALECGGYGGGHRIRAGATIECNELDRFRKGLEGVIAS